MSIAESKVKRALWYTTGMISLGLAYIGFVTPGIPFSVFLVFSAYCFSKSSQRMHDYLYNHKHFGPFLTNWIEKKVFPLRFKYAMLLVMSSSIFLMGLTPISNFGIMSSASFMGLVAIWAWRYPSSVEEYEQRLSEGKRIGWLS